VSATDKSNGSLFAELKRRNVVRVAALYLVAAWLILQIGDVLFGIAGVPDWSGRLLLILLALGYPVALIIAWVYELTPEGLKKQHEVNRQRSIVHETARKLDIAIGVLAGIAILAVMADRWIPRATSPAVTEQPIAAEPLAAGSGASVQASIAVLPFADMSQQKDQEYFADGLSEELLNLLVQVEGLKVIGRTSSFQFKGRNEDLRVIGQQLGVATLLEGSVRKAGDKLRVTAELIRASDGSQLWSDTYDRQLVDVFAVQDDIAAAVVDVLRLKLLSGETPIRTERHDTEAYNLYLEGRFEQEQRTPESLTRAVALFRRAIDRDPDFALAWVGLSNAYQGQAGTTNQLPIHEGYRAAREAVERALALDPDLALAHTALGHLQASFDWDWAAADASRQRSYALAPNDPEILAGVATQDMTMGRFDDALHHFQEAIDRDPLRAGLYLNKSLTLVALGRFQDAEAVARQARELAPSGAASYSSVLALALLLQGRYDDAERELASETSALWVTATRPLLSYAQGRRAEADSQLQHMIDEDAQGAAYQIAEVYAFRGEPDHAFEWLERAFRQRDPGVSEILESPFLKRLAKDPRYAPFLKKVGLPNPLAT